MSSRGLMRGGLAARTVDGVTGNDDLAALPESYAEALRLRAEGLSAPEIAARVDVPVEALETLISLAEAKLARHRKRRTYEPPLS